MYIRNVLLRNRTTPYTRFLSMFRPRFDAIRYCRSVRTVHFLGCWIMMGRELWAGRASWVGTGFSWKCCTASGGKSAFPLARAPLIIMAFGGLWIVQIQSISTLLLSTDFFYNSLSIIASKFMNHYIIQYYITTQNYHYYYIIILNLNKLSHYINHKTTQTESWNRFIVTLVQGQISCSSNCNRRQFTSSSMTQTKTRIVHCSNRVN